MPGSLIFFFKGFLRVIGFGDDRFIVAFEEGAETCTVEDFDFVPLLEAVDFLTLLETETLVLFVLLAAVVLDFVVFLTAADSGFFLSIFGSLMFQFAGFNRYVIGFIRLVIFCMDGSLMCQLVGFN